ncbi:MAG TPA: ATP-binding protein [Stellaceae bacterium]
MPIALGVNLANGALVATVLAAAVSYRLLSAWLCLLAVVTAGRFLMWRGYQRTADEKPPTAAPYWAVLATAGAAAAGAVWGLGAAVLLPEPLILRVFLVFAVGGMCTGAVATLSPHMPALLAYVAAASLPVAVRFLIERTPTDAAMAGMILVYVAALSFAGRNFNRTLTESLRLRFALADRTRELDETNERLRATIEENRATESALRQFQKMEAIGHLTGGIAHDFNNLLSAVIGNLEMAISRVPGAGTEDGDTRRLTEPLRGALRAAERGATLTQRLLAFARKQRLSPAAVDVDTLIRGIEDLLRRTLGPAVSLEIVCEADVPTARVDANQLELAILNLAINGRDAMRNGGGTLRIGVRPGSSDGPDGSRPAELPDGDYVVVTVEDSGIGMDEATLARAFDPFFTTKPVGEGSGLGLPMVQGFAVQSDGTVRISSRVGEGTTVELWLPQATAGDTVAPLATAAAAEPPPSSAAKVTAAADPMRRPAERRRQARILLCDDDDDVRRMAADILHGEGYDVYAVAAAAPALHLLEEKSAGFDLLVADYAMSGMDGIALIGAARRHRPDLKALLITGHADLLQRGASALPAGVPLLPKPFKPAELAESVATLLAIPDSTEPLSVG